MFGRLRSVLRHSRIPIRVGSAHHASNVYRVRFVKQPSKFGAGKVMYLISSTLITAVLAVRVVQVMSLGGQPLFIPLGFAEQEDPQIFKTNDPEVLAFLKFGSDTVRTRKARRVFEDKTIQVLQKSLPFKIGTQVQEIKSMLYFHYPHGPPPGYRQKGLQFIYKPPEPTAVSAEHQPAVIEINYTERHLEANQYLRRESILYPRWMFEAVKNSFWDIWADITSPRHPDEAEIEDMTDLIQYGADLSQWTLANLKDDLAKTRMRLPPPSGHVIIDGMVQVTSQNMLITVDLTGSFNPKNPEQATVHRMTVRYAAKLRPPIKVRGKPNPARGKPLSLGQQVVSGLKEDIEAAKEASTNDDRQLEKQTQRSGGGEKQDLEISKGPDIVGQLVKSNTPAGGETNMLDGDKKKDKPRGNGSRQNADIENSPPPRPSGSQSPPPPRE